MVYNIKEQEGGAHRMESVKVRRHDEGANDAAYSAYGLFGFRPAVAAGALIPLQASIWGIAVLPGQKKHAFAHHFKAPPCSEVFVANPAGLHLRYSPLPLSGGWIAQSQNIHYRINNCNLDRKVSIIIKEPPRIQLKVSGGPFVLPDCGMENL
jgi:hypothetical protein